MILTRQPAPLDGTIRLMFPKGNAPRKLLQAALLQVTAHESYGFSVGDDLICAFGFWPVGDDDGVPVHEFWLAIGQLAVPHLKALARLSRLALARLTQVEPVVVRALVRQGHAPGGRLARLAGLAFAGIVDGFEIWEIRHG